MKEEELLKVRHGLVSDDVAKMLREKGCDFFRSVVTQARAAKWLRDKYQLHINVGIANDYAEDTDGSIVDSWDFWCYDIYYTTNFSHHLVDCEGEFETYEEALNDGIKKALRYIYSYENKK